ncbi:MAG: TatD family hydrolase [Clostridia bacterium]|nr:TatD family hydrolase [Clostridia bacterium]
MLFDTHTHLNDESYTKNELEALIQEIEASQLSYVVDVGADLPGSITAIEHACTYPWCYASVGIHPEFADRTKERDMDTVLELAKNERVVAVGEIGLDYHYTKEFIKEQQYWFIRQIEIANTLRKPLIIHSREADQDTLDILKAQGVFSKERKSFFKDGLSHTVIHCFSGSKELALEYVKLGAYIGVDGPLTFRNNRKTVEVVKAVPLDRIVVETDAPYLTPEPFRGKKNKATNVEYVVRKVAEIKGISYEEAARATLENGKNLYCID